MTLRPYLLIGICALLAVALFVRDELESMAKRAWHRIACACAQLSKLLVELYTSKIYHERPV